MRRGATLQEEGRNNFMDKQGMAESSSNFQVCASTTVISKRQNHQRIPQTASVERSSRCVQKTGKKHYKTVEQVLQGNKETPFMYEGQQQTPVQQNAPNKSEAMSAGELGVHHKSKGYCGSLGNGVVVQMTDNRFNEQATNGRQSGNTRSSSQRRHCGSQKTVSCNVEHMSSSISPVTVKHTGASSNRKKMSESKIMDAGNQTLKVSNLETLVIQPGSPTVIEVRSVSSQHRKLNNAGYAQSTAQAGTCRPKPAVQQIQPTPAAPTSQQPYTCDVESEISDESSCDCETTANGDGPCATRYKRQGSQANTQRQSGNVTDTKNVAQSPCRISAHANKEIQPSVDRFDNKNTSNNQSADKKSGDSKQAKNSATLSSNNGQPIKQQSELKNEKQNCDKEKNPNASKDDDPLNKTLKVTNLDTVVIQPGSPTLIQVRSVRSGKSSINQESSDAVVYNLQDSSESNVCKPPEKQEKQTNKERPHIVNDQVDEQPEVIVPPQKAQSPQPQDEDDCCEWCEADDAAFGDGQFATLDESPSVTQKSSQLADSQSPTSVAPTPTPILNKMSPEDRKRFSKEVKPKVSPRQFTNTHRKSGRGLLNNHQKSSGSGNVGYQAPQSFQGAGRHQYVPVPECQPRQYVYPSYPPPPRQYSPPPAVNYQMPMPPQSEYPYMSRSSQNLTSAAQMCTRLSNAGVRYADPYQRQPPPPTVLPYQQYTCPPQPYPPTQQWCQPQVNHQYQPQDEQSYPRYQLNEFGVGDGQVSNYCEPEPEDLGLPENETYDEYYTPEHYDYCDENMPPYDYQQGYNPEKLINYDETGYVYH